MWVKETPFINARRPFARTAYLSSQRHLFLVELQNPINAHVKTQHQPCAAEIGQVLFYSAREAKQILLEQTNHQSLANSTAAVNPITFRHFRPTD